jgi:hypothetical protein
LIKKSHNKNTLSNIPTHNSATITAAVPSLQHPFAFMVTNDNTSPALPGLRIEVANVISV